MPKNISNNYKLGKYCAINHVKIKTCISYQNMYFQQANL